MTPTAILCIGGLILLGTLVVVITLACCRVSARADRWGESILAQLLEEEAKK